MLPSCGYSSYTYYVTNLVTPTDVSAWASFESTMTSTSNVLTINTSNFTDVGLYNLRWWSIPTQNPTNPPIYT